VWQFRPEYFYEHSASWMNLVVVGCTVFLPALAYTVREPAGLGLEECPTSY